MSDQKSFAFETDDLRFGVIEFVRAEWWKQSPRFVLLRYNINGHESPTGLRLDLDKRVLIDSLDDTNADTEVREHMPRIWTYVATALADQVEPRFAPA